MSARTTIRTRLFAATTVALAAFALTACEGGSDTGAAGPSSSTAATGQAEPSGGSSAGTGGKGAEGTPGSGAGGANGSAGSTASKAPTGSTGSGAASNGSSSGSGSQGGGEDSGVPGKCSASTVKITATDVSRPINHLLLTATNTGSKTCVLPGYPMARFGEAQAVPPVVEESKPQAVPTLEPGESGYAGVLLAAGDGSAENGHTVNSLTVPFDDGSIATVTLPAGGVHVDSSLRVTYWQPGVDLALTY
ncbi:hypothetical protein GCM10010129_15760 [Streptomyces fumigatiscleroticus]|nr:hypothetical protein GCM10010129_15760 [Streptomyces fumigatiscleroticus]